MTPRRTSNSAFTMIELILVLIIISITLALAAPSLRGWGEGQKLRNAADRFVAATGYARGQAVTTACVYAVEINRDDNTYVVQSVGADQQRKPVDGELGRPSDLPTSFTIQMVSGGDTAPKTDTAGAVSAAVLLFYPDARCTPAVVEIKTATGAIARIACSSPALPFKKVDVTP